MIIKIFLTFCLFLSLECGALTVGIPNSINSLSPLDATTAHNKYILHLVFDGLVTFDENNNIVSNLAKSWKKTNDSTVEFNLWENNKFSNGDDLVASDVVDSFKLLCSQKSNATQDFSAIKGCLEGKPSIRKTDKHKIEIKANSNLNVLLYQLASLRSIVFKKFNNDYIGTGPYKTSKINKKELVLDINIFYKKLNLTNRSISFVFFQNESQIFKALVANELDVSLVHISRVLNPKITKYYNIERDLLNITQTLFFNNVKKPFNNMELRRSLNHSIQEKSELLLKCLLKKSDISAEIGRGVVPRGLGGTISHLPRLKKTPDLKKMKLKEVQEVRLHQHIGRKNHCLEDNLKEIFREHNIDLVFKYHASYKTLFPIYLNGEFDLFIELLNYKNRDAYTILKHFVSKDNKENFAQLNDPSLDNILLSAIKASNPSQRYEYYRNAVESIDEKSYVVPLYYTNTWTYYKKCLKGFNREKSVNPFLDLIYINRDSCGK